MVLSHKRKSRRAGFIKPFPSPAVEAPQCGVAVQTAEVNFTCPNCSSLYEVAKAEAMAEAIDPNIACPTCDGPLPAREGQFALKYFLYRKTASGPKWQRLPLHAEPD